jgi:hypothetical protein
VRTGPVEKVLVGLLQKRGIVKSKLGYIFCLTSLVFMLYMGCTDPYRDAQRIVMGIAQANASFVDAIATTYKSGELDADEASTLLDIASRIKSGDEVANQVLARMGPGTFTPEKFGLAMQPVVQAVREGRLVRISSPKANQVVQIILIDMETMIQTIPLLQNPQPAPAKSVVSTSDINDIMKGGK